MFVHISMDIINNIVAIQHIAVDAFTYSHYLLNHPHIYITTSHRCSLFEWIRAYITE